MLKILKPLSLPEFNSTLYFLQFRKFAYHVLHIVIIEIRLSETDI